ncbi:hypothetical protein BZARG_3037 [Bizionia argentinensis JUB59]|uniref:VanZ family protein n=1 Tax=Bizionia argentinensis JUB59 TaxID=1046627 RepID=G2EFE7_9FLAO|nr:membrane protein [Bizionia argentinensis]EGV42838.1 hypothetical protein BZARG_3037 [Bizionia argentinensis JUB59]
MKAKIKPKKGKLYLTISISSLTTALLLTMFYRPFIYENKINDFGFSDTIGSLVSVIGFCFFVWGLKAYSNNDKNKQIIIATIIYAFGWEFFGYLRIYGTFDYKDIIAAVISGIMTFLLKEFIEKKWDEKNLA